ncbi:hypothetical protein PENTCL1PPCAC_5876, partial [Pristionchus entomophagus]
HPLFLDAEDVTLRIARDLVHSGTIPYPEQYDGRLLKQTYDILMMPVIYNPVFSMGEFNSRDSHSIMTEVQGAMIDFGSYEWMKWFMKRLDFFDFNKSDFSYYRRTIAERELCLRDEMQIKRIQEALNSGESMKSQDEIRMDSFVNSIVEKITRGERLVQIRPPFADKKTADKLARFIRSRRMPPTDF